jgi:hypothetical protein
MSPGVCGANLLGYDEQRTEAAALRAIEQGRVTVERYVYRRYGLGHDTIRGNNYKTDEV